MEDKIVDDKMIKRYFLRVAHDLSLDFSEQEKMAQNLKLGDYFTDDMANDWVSSDFEVLLELAKHGKVSLLACDLFKKIDNNFISFSQNGVNYNSDIWTIDSLKTHPFWSEQRHLAIAFIKELEQ